MNCPYLEYWASIKYSVGWALPTNHLSVSNINFGLIIPDCRWQASAKADATRTPTISEDITRSRSAP
jgi:hypothetical protein